MIYGVYVIRDLKTGYLTPTIDINDAAAIRNFEHAFGNESTLFYSHPQDYQLVKIGQYDSDTGIIDNGEQYRAILRDGGDVLD